MLNIEDLVKKAANPRGVKKNALKLNLRRNMGYVVPDWYKKLPYVSNDHGSNANQKRAWRFISQYVRRRDFKKYGGKCVSCWRRAERWEDMVAAHFIAWSVCYGMFKYSTKNLAASCSYCNSSLSGKEVGYEYAEELKRRGIDPEALKAENLSHKGTKIEDWMLVEMVEKLNCK